MASATSAETFFQQYWPEASAVGDPRQVIYRMFGVGIGSISQFFKPQVWRAYWANRSHGVGFPNGNTMRNPGSFLVHENQILYSQPVEHFGAQVDVDKVRALGCGD